MFVLLLLKSLARRRSRKMLAVAAVWIGMSLVTALLTLNLDVGDKMNRELQSLGANIRLLPAAAAIPVRVGGYELAAAAKPGYLEETNLDKLRDIFWVNNLLGVVPRLWVSGRVNGKSVSLLGVRFRRQGKAGAKNSASEFYGYWKVIGHWPNGPNECLAGSDTARALGIVPGDTIRTTVRGHSLALRVSGVASTGGAEDTALILPLRALQGLAGLPGKISEADISPEFHALFAHYSLPGSTACAFGPCFTGLDAIFMVCSCSE